MNARQISIKATLLVAAALTMPVVGFAQTQVNISGATLVSPTMDKAYMSNDFIDVDGDGHYGYASASAWGVDQLAPTISIFSETNPIIPTYQNNSSANNPQWLVNYRGVGSVNGLTDLVNYGLQATIPTSIPGERGLINRSEYALKGSWKDAGGKLTAAHDPYRHASGSPVAMTSIDIAVLDVGTKWAVQNTTGTAAWNLKPGQAGYGTNSAVSNTGWTNTLASLQRTVGSSTVALNTNVASPDSNTVYDTAIAFVPVVTLVNAGVNLDGNNDGIADGNVRYTTLQHLMTTGRTETGENLVAGTRSAGSGTHNAYSNSLGIDPSWGRGDGTGSEFIQAEYGYLGTGAVGSGTSSYVASGVKYQASFAEASSGVEEAVRNSRLGIGYTGIAGRGSHWSEGRYEIANVMKDISGGTTFVRPTIQNIINPAGEGYEIGGNAVWATIGDPNAIAKDYDGNGTIGTRNKLASDGTVIGTEAAPWELGTGNPAMANQAAADYVRNIAASLEAYTTGPTDTNNLGTPGQGLGNLFFLEAGMKNNQSLDDGTLFTANGDLDTTLQSTMLSKINIGLGAGTSIGDYGTSASPYGKVSRRKGTEAGVAYSDGAVTVIAAGNASSFVSGNAYVDIDGSTSGLTYGNNLTLVRNAVSGDFGGRAVWDSTMGFGDGKRDINDIPKMMQAMAYQLGAAGVKKSDDHDGNGMANTRLAVALIGDFDGDGNFNAEDVRYFADGLAMTVGTNGDYYSRKLDRKAGFTAVDNAWTVDVGSRVAGNFFATTLATGKTYAAGDSRGDVAGAAATLTAGAAPVGADGIIDANDIDFVYAQFKNTNITDGAANWSNLNEAVFFDLSGDMTGDLVVNQADVDELVTGVLGTHYGDINLDGNVDQTDLNTMVNNWGTAANAGWAKGDLNGDGAVDQLDLNTMVNNWALGLTSNEVIAAYGLSIPEPTSMALLAIGGMMLAARRRQA